MAGFTQESSAQHTLRVLAIASLLLDAVRSIPAGAGVCPHFQQPPYTCITHPSAMSPSRIARSPLCSAEDDPSPSCRRIASTRPPLLLHLTSPSLPGRARRAALPSPHRPEVSTATNLPWGMIKGGVKHSSGPPAVSNAGAPMGAGPRGHGLMGCCLALPMSRPSTIANSSHTVMRLDLG